MPEMNPRWIVAFALLLGAACARADTQEPFVANETPVETPAETWPIMDRFQTLRFDTYSVIEGLSQSSARIEPSH